MKQQSIPEGCLSYGMVEKKIFIILFIKQIYECALSFPFYCIVVVGRHTRTHVNGHLRLG